MARSILVIDDEQSIQASIQGALSDEGYRVFTASSGKEGIQLMRKENPGVILLDIWMTEMDGLETLKLIREERPDQTVVMMSGHGTIETAVKTTKLGAYDFVEKPLSLERLLVLMKNAFQAIELARENKALRKQVQKPARMLLGGSPIMEGVRQLIQRVAPTTGSVLITGENGTGKELVAHNIHALSQRYNKPFIEVNCAAIPEELIESELFGHEKGAFTGATQMRRGKFDLANGGTIFLDEIGDMSLKTQAKILRILQEQKFERVGGNETNSVDARIVAATNKDLKKEIQNGAFREDLYYRLNVIPFHIPPLRDRSSDIPLLSETFIDEFSELHHRPKRKLTPEALQALSDYSWPGNVRELRNLIERAVILTPENEEEAPVTAADILEHLRGEVTGLLDLSKIQSHQPPENPPSKSVKNLKDARHAFEKEFILKTLRDQEGNVSKTANVLGIERSHLHRKIKSYGIEI